MNYIDKGVLFVFDREVKRDILTYFREQKIYCEAVKSSVLEEYLRRFAPMVIVKDHHVALEPGGKAASFNLDGYDAEELEKISAFLEKMGMERFWDLDFYIEKMTGTLRSLFSANEIPLITLSTGVDSTVLSVFLSKILDRKIKCIFIGNGLNRLVDREDLEYLKENYPLLDIDEIDISGEVIQSLEGVLDTETKKSLVKKIFRETLDKEIRKYTDGKNYKIVHGTIVTDTFNLFKVNSEHIAPFDCLIKPEVRELGRRLGLKDALVRKLKFPVFGYGRKITGEITREKLDKLKEVDHAFCQKVIEKNIDALEAQYIDVSLIVSDGITIMVYRVDRRIIDKKILSYQDCIQIIRDIERKHPYIDKSLLDVSGDTDGFFVKR